MEGPEIPPKHLKLTENKQGEAHDSPQDKFRLRPGFVNKITLMHNSTHFFFYVSVAAFALQSND